MKILIIATPRSGSTTLTRVLSEVYNIEPFFEPFLNSYIGRPYDNKCSRHIIKTMISDIDITTFNTDEYTHVIYLTRKNTLEAAQSFDYSMETHKGDPKKWHQHYILPKSVHPTKSFQRFKQEYMQIINSNSNVIYYEELYSRNKDTVYKALLKVNLQDRFEEIFSGLNRNKKYRILKQEII